MANGHGGKRKGAGGKAGVPRTKTKQAYEAIELAFEGIGGVKALTDWARENQSDFYKTIFPKIIPVQLTGEAGGPIGIAVSRIEIVPGVRSKD
jgi:hypothetical protein